MRFLKQLGWVCSAGALVACGGSSSAGFQNKPDAGDASSGTGGTTASGGGSSSGGLGGALGTGGVGGTGGALGTGGTTLVGDAGSCADPAVGTETALCVTFVPEKITARLDPALDKKGSLVVQVFGDPTPGKNATPLVERSLPLIAANELSVDALPVVRLVGALPSTVYVRAIFIDNPDGIKTGGALSYGTWLGGFNLTDGLQDKEPILPVSVTRGIGNSVSLDLVALRRLTVTVRATATPVGDGQGRITLVAANGNDPSKKPKGFGTATTRCVDILKGPVVATGFVIGKGPYWITGSLNDLGLPGDLPAGSLAALALKDGKLLIPQELVIGALDYAPTASIDLSYAVPWPSDAGAIPPNSCADLAAASDGGVDAGP